MAKATYVVDGINNVAGKSKFSLVNKDKTDKEMPVILSGRFDEINDFFSEPKSTRTGKVHDYEYVITIEKQPVVKAH